jgi:thioredoxin-related protein
MARPVRHDKRENVGGKFRLIALAGFLSLLACQSSVAAELVMFRRVGCPYCLAWDRIIGPVYPKTELGRRVPKLDLQRAVRYTPTFVLVEGGRELGRIEGYPGEDFFGGLLEKLVRGLPPGS